MSVRVLEGDVRAVLASPEPKCCHVCVTSPPYWQLRAYGTPAQVWGGAEGCEHVWGEPESVTGPGKRGDTTVRWQHTGQGQSGHEKWEGAFCARCGAWRGELGQEPTPELYVEHLVACFRAVGRVLRDDGTLWVNLAGAYYNDPGGQNGSQGSVSAKAVAAG